MNPDPKKMQDAINEYSEAQKTNWKALNSAAMENSPYQCFSAKQCDEIRRIIREEMQRMNVITVKGM